MKNNEAIEIYIHVPFCARKCAYCDFMSFVKDDSVKKAYFEALNKEIIKKSEPTGKLPVDSVFFGGGTPSLVDASLITGTLDNLRRCFDIKDEAEITIEMNPNSGSYEKLIKYREAGINRLSIGLQSTVNEELKTLSRLHTYEEFLETFAFARKAGFDNINIDLMSALPGQSLDSYRETLNRVISLNPEHISAYSLIIEEGTPFYERYRDGAGLPDEDLDRGMYHLTKELLIKAGYRRYEISNYSKPGFECKHNTGYWTRKPYLGFGIAAASLYHETRYAHTADLDAYISGDYSETAEELTEADRMEEFMFLGLRLTEGVKKEDFLRLFGKPVEDIYAKEISKLSKEGLLINTDRLYLTDRGLDVANYCMSEFIL